MTESKHTSQERNKRYFQSFIATRASMGMLGVGLAGFIIGSLALLYHWATAVKFGWNPPYDFFSATLLISIIFMFISFLINLIEPFRYYFYQHQRFSSIWQLIFVVFLLYDLSIITLLLIVYDEPFMNLYDFRRSLPFLILATVSYIICIAYNIHWIHRQLQVGMSEERARKNFQALPAIYSSKTLLFILSVVLLGGIIFSGLSLSTLWVFALLLFIGAFSRLHVEYAYAAVLKWRDREYWEEYRREDGISSQGLHTLLRWGLEILIFATFIFVGMYILPQSHFLVPVCRFGVIGMVIYWLARIFIRKKKL
ncbi:hypothetical protein HO447_10425 [Streptococcus suis]|nr:hypothetical protein [Streptococcus suis]